MSRFSRCETANLWDDLGLKAVIVIFELFFYYIEHNLLPSVDFLVFEIFLNIHGHALQAWKVHENM